MKPYLDNDWDEILEKEFNKEYFKKLMGFLDLAYETNNVFPKKKDIFNAFKNTSFENTNVVILGQDPYIRENQAHGYSFSVLPGNDIPPSLMNIFKELKDEMDLFIPDNGCLIPWAEQGVLLLNSILTVNEGISNSHKKKGWEEFTDNIINILNDKENIVFMLWGKYACKKGSRIDKEKHLVLEAAHPSPLAGGQFFGCNHFIKCNEYLLKYKKNIINWQIPNLFKKGDNK